MTDPLQALDTVLTALREAEPSPGFERRLLQTLAMGEAGTLQPIRRWSWLPVHLSSPRRAAALASVAALLLASISLTVLSRHHPSAAVSTRLSPARTATPPTHLDLAAAPPSEQVLQKQTSQRRPHHVHPAGIPGDPAHLASFPAPPLPLTAQEKLLVRVAHAQNPQGSPILNPALRASLTARDRESFQIFFASATTIRPFVPTN